MIDPAHGGKEHLVLTVHSQELRGREHAEHVLADLVPLLLLADQIEIILDIVES